MKRVFDILVSVILILILLPVFIVIAILIKLESKGPMLFKQQRVGFLGEPFTIFKFRSMVVESESIGPYFTVEGDPRITRLGRFLRRSSLDEIPQLLNVLRGDMSLVGPRPNVFAQRTDYTLEEWGKRHSVKPGITGLHQALYRSNSTLEQRNIIDLEYVDKQSFFLDLKIILWTAKQVLFKGGN